MNQFATRLRQRAKELGISNSEAARRSGLSEQRYGHYIRGFREPRLATLVRIAAALETTPDALLGVGSTPQQSRRGLLRDRLNSAVGPLREQDLELLILLTEALAQHRKRSSR